MVASRKHALGEEEKVSDGALVKKRVLEEEEKASDGALVRKRVHKKIPGFNVFGVQSEPEVFYNFKKVVVEDAKEPETGIHSLEWAQAIKHQKGFMSLAYETRLKIYRLVIEDFQVQPLRAGGSSAIVPRKKGNKFCSWTWPNAAEDTERLYMICRQSYVDVVGAGLIYETLPFSFTSPTSLLNYLLVIHPVHKDAIRTVDLTFRIPSNPKLWASLAFDTLASMPNLRHLKMLVILNKNLFIVATTLGGQIIRPAAFTLKKSFIDRFIGTEELVGNGRRGDDGGKGGIRKLKTLDVKFTYPFLRGPNYLDFKPGEFERWESLETALRAIMIGQ